LTLNVDLVQLLRPFAEVQSHLFSYTSCQDELEICLDE